MYDSRPMTEIQRDGVVGATASAQYPIRRVIAEMQEIADNPGMPLADAKIACEVAVVKLQQAVRCLEEWLGPDLPEGDSHD